MDGAKKESDEVAETMKVKVLTNTLNHKKGNMENLNDLISYGKEFLDDADENDKKQYQKIIRNKMKKQNKLTRDEMMYGIMPDTFMTKNSTIKKNNYKSSVKTKSMSNKDLDETIDHTGADCIFNVEDGEIKEVEHTKVNKIT